MKKLIGVLFLMSVCSLGLAGDQVTQTAVGNGVLSTTTQSYIVGGCDIIGIIASNPTASSLFSISAATATEGGGQASAGVKSVTKFYVSCSSENTSQTMIMLPTPVTVSEGVVRASASVAGSYLTLIYRKNPGAK